MKYINILLVCFLVLLYSCATIVMPSGGPTDTTPPEVVNTYPENNSILYGDNKVVLYFDEFIELNQPLTNIAISPYSTDKPIANIVGKKLILKFEKGFIPNTTYSIEFNNAIKDFNEGNLLTNFKLVFSTGSKLDTAQALIKVEDAITKSSNEMTKVVLVKNKSDFYGKNYSYVSAARNGVSTFNVLKREPYYVFAFADSNMNMTWEKTEPIGFFKEPIDVGKPIPTIPLFQQEMAKPHITISAISAYEYLLNSSQDLHYPEVLDSNVILIFLNAKTYKLISKEAIESSEIRLKYNVDKFETIKLPFANKTRYIERLEDANSRMTTLVPGDSVRIEFNGIITNINKDKIKLLQDGKPQIANIHFANNTVVLTLLDFGKKYELQVDSLAIWSGVRYIKALSYAFETLDKKSYYPEIIITLDPNLASNKTIKCFIYKNNQWAPFPKLAKTVLKNTYGTELKFKLLIDENNDGIWTSGDVYKEKQPEKITIETIPLEPKKTDYLLKISQP